MSMFDFIRKDDQGRSGLLRGKKAIAAQRAEDRLRHLRTRGIWVLELTVDGQTWGRFYYPSEERRRHAATTFWRAHFDALDLAWSYKYIDPADTTGLPEIEDQFSDL